MELDFPNLPHEIIFHILSRLPVKPLCRFKSVSKSWLALITDPQFIKSHLLHQPIKEKMNQKLIMAFFNSRSFYSLDCRATDNAVAKLESPWESRVQFLGSVNGVLLLDLRIGDQLCIWNPAIRRYQKFLQPKYRARDIPLYGLGYDSISDDFKVVRVTSLMNNQAHCCDSFTMGDPPYAVHVFSSKLSSWKRIGDFGYSTHERSEVTVMNGAPHWVLSDMKSPKSIVCFDATEEKFKEVPKPNWEGVEKFIRLGVLGGRLYVTKSHRWSHVDVWEMKEYGVKESWTKLFVVPYVREGDFYFDHFKLLGYPKDGEVLMLLNSSHLKLSSNKLVIYEIKQNKYKTIEMPDNSEWWVVDAYVQSLFSPYGCAMALEGTANQMAIEEQVVQCGFLCGESCFTIRLQ